MSYASAKQKFIIAHFDAHGVSTAAAYARSNNIPAEKAFSKFPTTGPEQLPNYIDAYFPTLVQHDVVIIDIPVNIRNPRAYIDAINRLAMNTSVVIYDHHKTDYQYATQILAKLVIFGSGVEMADALSNDQNRLLAYIGVVADRDSSILSRVSREEVERELLPLANKLDVLARQDAEITLRNLVSFPDPVNYLRTASTEYPPEVLSRQVRVLRRGVNTVLVDMTGISNIQAWSWKTMEQIALTQRADYVVAISEVFDRQTNTNVPAVLVIKYWLSERPSPRPRLQPVLGRTTIGHDDAFSVRALDINDARALAETIFNELEAITPRVTHLINESRVAEALRYDFNAILQRLTQILEAQQKMYAEYLDLKRKQVELLERLRTTRAD
jgi:hypothetical protein